DKCPRGRNLQNEGARGEAYVIRNEEPQQDLNELREGPYHVESSHLEFFYYGSTLVYHRMSAPRLSGFVFGFALDLLLLGSCSKDSHGYKPSGEEEKKDVEDPRNEDSEVLSIVEPRVNQEKDVNVNSTNNINIVSPNDNAVGIEDNMDVKSAFLYGKIKEECKKETVVANFTTKAKEGCLEWNGKAAKDKIALELMLFKTSRKYAKGLLLLVKDLMLLVQVKAVR
nr:hypothetical protein [Tanacetum cinerariifolium]